MVTVVPGQGSGFGQWFPKHVLQTESKWTKTWVHVAKRIYRHQVTGKESAVFNVRCHTRTGQQVLKKSELPDGYQQSLLKDKVRRGVPGVELWSAHAQFIGQWWGCYRG